MYIYRDPLGPVEYQLEPFWTEGAQKLERGILGSSFLLPTGSCGMPGLFCLSIRTDDSYMFCCQEIHGPTKKKPKMGGSAKAIQGGVEPP